MAPLRALPALLLAPSLLQPLHAEAMKQESRRETSSQKESRVLTTRNLFSEYLGLSDAEVDARIEAGWRQLFEGDADNQRVYYETGDGMAYMLDTGNDDVRSEGMSYGMMLALQMDRQDVFDKLWRWTMEHMYHDSGPRKGYFAWHCRPDGTQLDPGSASDGEVWFATVLFYASARWGDGEGIFDYSAQANSILEIMMSKGEKGLGEANVINMFSPEEKQVRFVPLLAFADVTDPSYHVPAFYETWAEWAETNNEFWREAATESRQLFRDAAHPETGLMPDYSGFDGKPFARHGHENFLFDAHRTLGNVALDWEYFGVDPWQVEQSTRVLRFLSEYRPGLPFGFTLEGKPLTEDTAESLTAMAAVAALATDRELGEPFVRDLWEVSVPEGRYRYYNGLLYLMGMMQVGGRFHIWLPSEDAASAAATDARFEHFSYTGRDPSFELPMQPGQFRNPILPGFRPDPSICRVGEDYYLINSSFAYFPGVPIYTSRDLVNWRQIGHVLDRPSQLDIKDLRTSRAIFAPAITHHDGVFYMVTTMVDAGGNFYVTATDPAGPWSDPVWLPEVDGIDPSLYFAEDGRAWLVNNGPPPAEPLYEGHRAIWIQEFDVESGKLVGPRKIIINGGVDLSEKPVWIEGPHIFQRGDWYYLICAEGGTSVHHSQVVFRSRDPMGEWVPWDKNPMLTQRDLPAQRFMPVTATGHADFVDAGPAGWWTIFLGCQPYEEDYYNNGRQTFLLPVTWTEDGWPTILPEGVPVPLVADAPDIQAEPNESSAWLPQGNFSWEDSFDDDALGYDWIMLRTPQEQWWQFSDGALIISPRKDRLEELGQPSFLAYRIQHTYFDAGLDVQVPETGTVAGLALYQGELWHYFLGLRTLADGQVEAFLERADGDAPKVVSTLQLKAKPGDTIRLGVSADGRPYTFLVGQGEDARVISVEDGTVLSTHRAGGFVGATIGPFARAE